MVKRIVIPISELTSQTATRLRAREAFGNLAGRLRNQPHPVDFVLDTSQAELVSGSFLDELVLRIAEAHIDAGIRIVFRLSSKADLDKLQKVCTVRNAEYFYQTRDSATVRRTRRVVLPQYQVREYPGALFAG